MDNALWITWYDLPQDGRDAYLAWLHETYIPMLLRRPGFLWAAHYASVEKERIISSHPEFISPSTRDAAVPAGDRYILLFGAQDANVFGCPTPTALHAGLPEASRKMLALRAGERVNIMVEAARVDGPAASTYQGGMALGPCIQLGSFNCTPQSEEEMLAWYALWRMPAMRTLPGCIRTRKLASVVGWAKHAILYEYESVAIRNQYYPRHEEDRPDMKAWSGRMVMKLAHAPGSANLAVRIWPTLSG